MRIAVFIKSTHFHRGYGGLETQNKVLCEGLAKKGHEVFVFSSKRELTFDEKEETGVFYKFVTCVYRLTSFSKMNWVYKSLEAFKKVHLDNPFELVISQSSAGLGVIREKRFLDIPVVSISHGTILGEFKTRVKEEKSFKGFVKLIPDAIFVLRVFFGRQREFIHGSDKVVAVSAAVKKALIDETFVDEKKVVVINNAIDEKKYDNYKKWNLTDAVDVLYVGRVIRSKGIFDLIDVFSDPKFSKTHLHIVGEGEDKKGLVKRVSELGISKRVTFYGNIEHSAAIGKMFGADIFVLPSLRVEGFPMVLVEAMFASLPIVASDIGGISDAVVNGETGFLVAPGNKKEFAAKTLALVETKDLRKNFSEEAYEVALRKFSLNVMLEEYEKVLKGVLK